MPSKTAPKRAPAKPVKKVQTRSGLFGRLFGNKIAVIVVLLFAVAGTIILNRSSAQVVTVSTAAATVRVTGPAPGGGPGGWLMSADRYYVGRVYQGWKFKVNQVNPTVSNTGVTFVYGRAIGPGVSRCGWIDTGSSVNVGLTSYKVTDTSCMGATFTALDNNQRDRIGTRYNCPDSACDDGTHQGDSPVLPGAACNHMFYYNYSGGGRQPAGPVPSGNTDIHYRFILKGTPDAVVRSNTYGWGFISTKCFRGSLQNAGGHSKSGSGYWCPGGVMKPAGPCATPATIRARSR